MEMWNYGYDLSLEDECCTFKIVLSNYYPFFLLMPKFYENFPSISLYMTFESIFTHLMVPDN